MIYVEAKEIAEAANKSKDRFLARRLGHELRTPLQPGVDGLAAAMDMNPDHSRCVSR